MNPLKIDRIAAKLAEEGTIVVVPAGSDAATIEAARSMAGALDGYETCAYCDHGFPRPIGHHHSEQECADLAAKEVPDAG